MFSLNRQTAGPVIWAMGCTLALFNPPVANGAQKQRKTKCKLTSAMTILTKNSALEQQFKHCLEVKTVRPKPAINRELIALEKPAAADAGPAPSSKAVSPPAVESNEQSADPGGETRPKTSAQKNTAPSDPGGATQPETSAQKSTTPSARGGETRPETSAQKSTVPPATTKPLTPTKVASAQPNTVKTTVKPGQSPAVSLTKPATDELDRLLRGTPQTEISAKDKGNTPPAVGSDSPKQTTDQNERQYIRQAGRAIIPLIRRCSVPPDQTQIELTIVVQGSTGRVISAQPAATDPNAGTPLGICVARMAQLVRLPKSNQPRKKLDLILQLTDE